MDHSNNSNNSHVDTDNNFIANPSLKIDHVHLKVSDLQNSIDFYQSILGFKVLEDSLKDNTTYLGLCKSEQDKPSPLLNLSQIDKMDNSETTNPSHIKREAGLYHFAILLPERKYLASFLQHIRVNLEPQYYEGIADHAVSESIYLHDPDYNGIEVYCDRRPSEWKWTGVNKIYMVTEALDVDNLLNNESYGQWNGLPMKTSIGHVHLHVSNLSKAKNFYKNMIGLYHTASYPGAYFFAAGTYHHHIATNTWLGTNILPNSADNRDKVGLDHFAIQIPNGKGEETSLKSQFLNNGISMDENPKSEFQQKSTFYVYDHDRIKIQFIFY